MRSVDRTGVPIPAAMLGEDSKAANELIKARAHAASDATKAFKFKHYKDASVKEALESLFHGKCAYCETFYASTAPMDVEHYRPKGAVEGSEHPGYWWIAMDWNNLLPSCIDCNRKRKQLTFLQSAALQPLVENNDDFGESRVISTGKKDSFPIAGVRQMPEEVDWGTEEALLLDPSIEDPSEHIEFNILSDQPIAFVFPKKIDGASSTELIDAEDADTAATKAELHGLSQKGAVSIQVYGLNRLKLVQERTGILRHLEFLKTIIIDLDDVGKKVADLKVGSLQKADKKLVLSKLSALENRILDEIKKMASEQSPYSVMVRSWLDNFLAEME